MRQILILGALALGLCVWAQNAMGDVATIKVTKTWGDLVATAPLIFDQPPPATAGTADDAAHLQFWIGVDRDQVNQNGTVLLYCLEKGHRSLYGPGPGRLGPFKILVKGATQRLADKQIQAMAAPMSLPYTLFSDAVPVDAAENYTIELQYDDGAAPAGPGKVPKTIARLQVNVSAGPSEDLWSPWGESPKEDDRESHGGGFDTGEGFALMIVCNPAGAVAMPKPPPAGAPIDHLPAPGTPLPTIYPVKPDAGVVLQMVGDTFVVSVPQDIDPEYPDDHFLTRWWINGKAWKPDPAKGDAMRARSQAAAEQLRAAGSGPKAVHFQLDFKPERLGVKKGDVVGVQLLFCPGGWASVGPWQEIQALADVLLTLPTDPPQSFSLASNRVEFTYSGNPASPQL